MAWTKVDEMFSKSEEAHSTKEYLKREKAIKEELTINLPCVYAIVNLMSVVLDSFDSVLKENYKVKDIPSLDSISYGVTPFGSLSFIVEGYREDDDYVVIPAKADYVSYASSLNGSDGKNKFVKVVLPLSYNFSILLPTLFQSQYVEVCVGKAFCIKDGMLTVFENGIGSRILYTFSLKTGEVI